MEITQETLDQVEENKRHLEIAKCHIASIEHLISLLKNGERCSIQVGQDVFYLLRGEAFQILQLLHSGFEAEIRGYEYYIKHPH